MPNSKLKNLTILILLLANLCLLAVILPIHMEQQREAENSRQSVSRLYENEHLHLDPAIIPETDVLYALQLGSDGDGDYRAVTALLGEQVLAEDSSTRYLSTYQSRYGQCTLSRSGGFEAVFSDGQSIPDIRADSRKILRAMGFQPYYLGEPSRLDDGTYVVQASQAVLGVPIFSQGLQLVYEDGRLAQISGTFYTGTNNLTRVSEDACLSAVDALVRFLSARFDLGWVGSTILSMEQGYLRTETAAAATVHLVPVWRISTDTGSFYINGLTGDVSSISA